MVLVPLLTLLTNLKDTEIFPASISIILPICLTSLARTPDAVIWQQALPYLLGSALGGLAAGKWGKKIPVLWLHRGLGILILWGGWRLFLYDGMPEVVCQWRSSLYKSEFVASRATNKAKARAIICS